MPDITSGILGLRSWAALGVVFLLPALESSAFIGFIFPGEIAVVLGGVLAFNHRVNLILVMVAAVLGATVGDSVGYAVGHRWGNRLLEGRLSRLIRQDHADRAKQYLVKRGGRAVFLGRFTAALRVMIPGLAGMSGVPYRRFLISNVLGGTIWAVSFVLLGYAAGASWRKVATTARNAGLLLLAVLIVLILVAGVARWIARHPDRFRSRLAWIGRLPGIRWARRRFERQLAWLVERLRPSGLLGLSLTLGFSTILLLGTGFAVLAGAVAGQGVQDDVDRPVLDWLVNHRSPGFTSAMKLTTLLASAQIVIPLVVVTGGVWWLLRAETSPRRRLRPLVLLAAASAGAAGLSNLMKVLVERPRPPLATQLVAARSWSFPSGHATEAVALYGGFAALLAASTGRWSLKVSAWAIAFVLIAGIGFSRLYLGIHWLTDVLGSFALGAVWLGLVLMVTRVIDTIGSRRGRAAAEPHGAGMTVPSRR